MSPAPTTLPSGSRAVSPLMKSSVPEASHRTACENTPRGLLRSALRTSSIGIGSPFGAGLEGGNLSGSHVTRRAPGWRSHRIWRPADGERAHRERPVAPEQDVLGPEHLRG